MKMSEFRQGMTEFFSNMSAGKLILCPHDIDEALEKVDHENDERFEEFDLNEIVPE